MNRAILIGLVVTGAAAAAACGSSGSSTGSGVPISTETNQDPLPNPQDPPPDPQNPLPSTQNPPPNPQNPPASSEQPTASGSSTSAPAISCGDLCNGVDSSCAGLCQQLCAALDVLGSDCAESVRALIACSQGLALVCQGTAIPSFPNNACRGELRDATPCILRLQGNTQQSSPPGNGSGQGGQ